MDKVFTIEESSIRSGNGRLYRGTLKWLKSQLGLNESKEIPYKWNYIYIQEPTTVKELVRSLNKLAKYDSQHEGLQYKLISK